MTPGEITGQLRRSAARILVLEDGIEDGRSDRQRVLADDALAVDFRALNSEMLQSYAPDIVVAPVVSARFDCMDVARTLVDCDFQGLLRVLTAKLPCPDLVAHELSSTYPMLKVDFLALDPLARAMAARTGG